MGIHPPGEFTNQFGRTEYTQYSNGAGEGLGPGRGSCVNTVGPDISLTGPPVLGGILTGVENIATTTNVAAVATAIKNYGGYLPVSGTAGQDQLILWEVNSSGFPFPLNTSGVGGLTIVPSPAANSNQSEGASGTSQFLATQEIGKGVTQGTAQINQPNPFSGCIPTSQIQSYRWE